MGDIAIRVDGLGKQYRIGAQQKGYRTFRDVLTEAITMPIRRVGGLLHGNAAAAADLSETIWALKDVSFEVKKGEVVGIIGRNGAGKSTLLKILSRITEPSTGEARVYGRVGALLEVGTGFHPELTGRENIYLNGAILGMSRAEISRKFDEIVAFAEVERFIDTPVKHYSSGMGLRLGFAVAAHLEPEILIVDEVLAVGDAAFQKKCLGKMGEVAGEGRTVLFVSHNMTAVQGLCSRATLLHAGRLTVSGSPAEVIGDYLEFASLSRVEYASDTDDGSAIILRQVHCEQEGTQTPSFDPQKPIRVIVSYDVVTQSNNVLLGFDVLSSDGAHIFRTYNLAVFESAELQPGTYNTEVVFPGNLFKPGGTYFLEFLLGIHRVRWLRRNDPRLKITFLMPQTTDINDPGLLQNPGYWTIPELVPETLYPGS